MTFEEACLDEYCSKILNLLHRWLPNLPKSELKQLQLIALWEACDTFDPARNCKFTTHLYNRVRFKYLKHINSPMNKKIGQSEEIFQYRQEINLNLFFDGLEDLDRSLLEDRFVNKLTLREMTNKYNMKRKDLVKALSAAKETFKEMLEC